MKIDKLKPGMVVYDVRRRRMGNTRSYSTDVFTVAITHVHPDGHCVWGSWNGNAEERFGPQRIKKWRLKRPIMVKSGIGQRLATRAEIAAMKSSV